MEDRFRFRAWDIEKKGMSYFHNKRGMQYNNDEIRISNGWDGNDNPKYWSGDDEEYVDRTDKYILMQSTGLKDKNGKLIYEGDIVKVKGKQTDETIGFIEWLNDFGKFSLNVDSCCIYTDFDYLPEKEIEIIGNIYEKKELLKEQK